MKLNTIQSLRTEGTPGADGTAGANGTDAIPNGGAGSSGRPSAAVLLGRDWRTLLGDADGDRVSFELQANSGIAGDADVAEVS